MNLNLTEKQERMAIFIASKLDDMDSLQWHRQNSLTFSEEYLLQRLDKVLKTPEKQIRVSRAALYNALVTGRMRYGK